MASSASLQRFLPPSAHSTPSSSQRGRRARRPVLQCSAVSAPSSSSPAPAAGAVAAERLEPRVEQREGGYWVLKEKYRTGLNPQEKVKLGKEPMALFTESGIRDLAKIPMAEIDADKLAKEDVDVRLKWLGLFHRRKQQCMPDSLLPACRLSTLISLKPLIIAFCSSLTCSLIPFPFLIDTTTVLHA